MKKLFFIIFSLVLSASLFSSEIFVQEGGKIFKVTLSDNGDTLSKEEISIIPLDTVAKETEAEMQKETAETEISPQPALYNPQLLRIVPFKWQAGWYGAWQGFSYGAGITMGLGISNKRYAPLIYLSTPTLMFFLPPILIKDEVPDYSLAFIDWGYRLGPADYMVLKAAISSSDPLAEDSFLVSGTYHKYNIDALMAVTLGYGESWGGYAIARKMGPFRRAASDMYAAGAYMGYVWGGLTGIYLAEKLVTDEPVYDTTWFMDSTKWVEDSTEEAAYQEEFRKINQKKEIYGFSTAFLFSLGFRAAGFYFGNKEEYKLKSFDGYFYTFNSIPGFLLAFELENYVDLEDEALITYTAMSMLTTGATAYLMKDIHLDDGNAVLMMIGGVVGGSLGQGVERVIAGTDFTGDVHTSIGALCMIAGELGVYYLRKDAIESGSDFGSNIGFNVYPTNNNGLGVNLSYSF